MGGREPISAPKIFKEDMKIDWTKEVHSVYNHIRGLSPFPTAWTELIHKETAAVFPLKIFKTEKIVREHQNAVGTIVIDGKKTFDIYVEDGMIRVIELQLSGKKRMGVEEFLRGFRLEEYLIKQ